MKKLIYLFVMVAGMTLASVNVNAQDSKPKAATSCSKDCKKSCCSGDKAACKGTDKTCSKKEADKK